MGIGSDVISRFWIPILFIILSIPLILKIVSPNQFYGVRSKKTLSNSAVWYNVNRYGGWYLFSAGIILFIYRILEPHFVVLQNNFKTVVFLVFIVLLIALTIRLYKSER